MQGIRTNKYWFLKQISLFSELSKEEMKAMESITREEFVHKKQPVYLPGEAGNSVYLLKQGRIKISKLT